MEEKKEKRKKCYLWNNDTITKNKHFLFQLGK